MKLLTKDQERRLLANGRRKAAKTEKDADKTEFVPVVKLFCPWGAATWLLTELDTEDPDIAFGLCDLGMGNPELGRVRLSELAELRGPGGLRIERDRFFKPDKTIGRYANEARQLGYVRA